MEPYRFTNPFIHRFRQLKPFSLGIPIRPSPLKEPSLSCEEVIRARKQAEYQYYDFCMVCAPHETTDYLFVMNERVRLYEALESARMLERTVFGLK